MKSLIRAQGWDSDDGVCTVQAGVQMAHWRRGVVSARCDFPCSHLTPQCQRGQLSPTAAHVHAHAPPTVQPGVLRSSVSEAASYDTMRDFDLLPFFPTCLLELLPPQPRCHPPTPPMYPVRLRVRVRAWQECASRSRAFPSPPSCLRWPMPSTIVFANPGARVGRPMRLPSGPPATMHPVRSVWRGYGTP